jgi:hypothetical protein
LQNEKIQLSSAHCVIYYDYQFIIFAKNNVGENSRATTTNQLDLLAGCSLFILIELIIYWVKVVLTVSRLWVAMLFELFSLELQT